MTASTKQIDRFDLRSITTDKKFLNLIHLMSGYGWKYLGATIAISISSMSRTANYLLLQFFIDDYLTNQSTDISLLMIAGAFVLLTVITGFMSFESGRLTAETSEGVTKRLRDHLFDHIQHLSFKYHNETDTGDLIQRSTSDVDTLRGFYANNAIGIARTAILFLVNFFAIMHLNTKLALISIIAIPIVVIISAVFFKQIRKRYEEYQEKDAELSTTLQENLSGVRVVKAFARQNYEIEKFEINNLNKLDKGKKLVKMHSFFWPISDIICSLQIVFGYYFAARLVLNAEITIGTFLAYSGMLMWIIFPMRNLGRLIVETSRVFVSLERVGKIIKENQEPLDKGDYQPEQLIGDLKFEQVGFAYEDGHPVLEDITFEVKAGQAIALLGSTGSGKTSLVNLLPRFFEYTSGKISLDGVELNRYPRNFLRRNIGTVEQEPFLFSRTIRDNIMYGVDSEVTEEQMIQAAKAAAVHDVIMDFPKGYDTLVGEKGVTLSGGQKQRVTIARTLLRNPKILIMDDSTSAVDTETEASIREALNNLMENRTTFIIAHRIQSIMNADLILVLDDGKIIQSGTHEELLQVEGTYRNIFDIQTKIELDLEKEIESVN